LTNFRNRFHGSHSSWLMKDDLKPISSSSQSD